MDGMARFLAKEDGGRVSACGGERNEPLASRRAARQFQSIAAPSSHRQAGLAAAAVARCDPSRCMAVVLSCAAASSEVAANGVILPHFIRLQSSQRLLQRPIKAQVSGNVGPWCLPINIRADFWLFIRCLYLVQVPVAVSDREHRPNQPYRRVPYLTLSICAARCGDSGLFRSPAALPKVVTSVWLSQVVACLPGWRLLNAGDRFWSRVCPRRVVSASGAFSILPQTFSLNAVVLRNAADLDHRPVDPVLSGAARAFTPPS